jgi:phage shock protein A
MKLIRKVKIALRSAVHDLLSEDEYTPEGEDAALLSAGQKRLEQLRQKVAPTTAREKRAQLEQRKALAEAQALNKAADDAIIAGRDDLAIDKLRQAQQALQRAAEAEEQQKRYAELTATLRAEISQLEANRQPHPPRRPGSPQRTPRPPRRPRRRPRRSRQNRPT